MFLARASPFARRADHSPVPSRPAPLERPPLTPAEASAFEFHRLTQADLTGGHVVFVPPVGRAYAKVSSSAGATTSAAVDGSQGVNGEKEAIGGEIVPSMFFAKGWALQHMSLEGSASSSSLSSAASASSTAGETSKTEETMNWSMIWKQAVGSLRDDTDLHVTCMTTWGDELVTGTNTGPIIVWNTSTGECVTRFFAGRMPVEKGTKFKEDDDEEFDPDKEEEKAKEKMTKSMEKQFGKSNVREFVRCLCAWKGYLYSGGNEQHGLKIWSRKGKCLARLEAPAGGVQAIHAYSTLTKEAGDEVLVCGGATSIHFRDSKDSLLKVIEDSGALSLRAWDGLLFGGWHDPAHGPEIWIMNSYLEIVKRIHTDYVGCLYTGGGLLFAGGYVKGVTSVLGGEPEEKKWQGSGVAVFDVDGTQIDSLQTEGESEVTSIAFSNGVLMAGCQRSKKAYAWQLRKRV